MPKILYLILFVTSAAGLLASDLDEFKSGRGAVFEFALKPQVKRTADQVTIEFEAQGFCDVTVALENENGKIVRHLASGVLGPNAPEPFQKNTKKQTLIWDGKDERGMYVDDKARITVRVSLGLRPQLERTLYWSPYKRISSHCPLIQAAEDGVYVYDGRVVDSIRVYDHKANYARTAYPFPGNKLNTFKDLHWHKAPQDGARLPRKEGFHTSTLLTSGNNEGFDERRGFGVDRHNNHHGHVSGNAATTMAVGGGQIALAKLRTNRFRTDGSGSVLKGTKVTLTGRSKQYHHGKRPFTITPYSSALSPDGKWLYLAGYRCRIYRHWDCMDVVMRVNLAEGSEAQTFLGTTKLGGGTKKEGSFRGAASVAVDAKGRIHVADFTNDRIQIFNQEGSFLKAIPTPKPALVRVHAKTGEIYVFSWLVHCRHYALELPGRKRTGKKPKRLVPTLRKYAGFKDPKLTAKFPLPLPGFAGTSYKEWTSLMTGPLYWAEVDSWADPPAIWLGRQNTEAVGFTGGHLASSAFWTAKAWDAVKNLWDRLQIKVFQEKEGKLVLQKDFGREAKQTVRRTEPQKAFRQRLYVNPTDEMLYVGEGDAANKAFKALVKIDPRSGKVLKLVNLPFDAEDAAFDLEGYLYLRTDKIIARYDPKTFREVPWDYGEERLKVGFSSSRDGRKAPTLSGLVTTHDRNWHHGGLWVAPNGTVVAGGYNPNQISKRKDEEKADSGSSGAGYVPPMYPGRMWGKGASVLHVWDRHGKLLHADALPGLMQTHGLAIDNKHDLYVLASAPRYLDGKRYFNKATGTLIKCEPGKARIASISKKGVPILLNAEDEPKRNVDLGIGGKAWTKGAKWFYGGVGFSGDSAIGSSHCSCFNMRFGFDLYARSFVPETDHYSVGVLDRNGNLICRVGQYGNVDDGKPLLADPELRNARSIGGDEVALFHACYVATHSDRHLFISDGGNACIRSVKLGYHAEERVALKDVPDRE